KAGTQKWAAASSIPGLFPATPPTPAAPAPSPMASPPQPRPGPAIPPVPVEGREWYYVKDRQKIGPVSAREGAALLAVGELAPEDMVLRAGTQKWLALHSVPDLRPASARGGRATPAASRLPQPVGPGAAQTPEVGTLTQTTAPTTDEQWFYALNR